MKLGHDGTSRQMLPNEVAVILYHFDIAITKFFQILNFRSYGVLNMVDFVHEVLVCFFRRQAWIAYISEHAFSCCKLFVVLHYSFLH
jgi:hypothetical protein